MVLFLISPIFAVIEYLNKEFPQIEEGVVEQRGNNII